MLKYLVLALILSACSSTDGPQVDALVKPGQEKWLEAQIERPIPQRQLLVFGDSLSDPGNLNANTFGLYLPPAVFYRSRVSNGPIWADYVAAALGWKLVNYAVAGAKTRGEGFIDFIAIPGFLQQIDQNRAALKRMNAKETVVAIWIGPNNYFTFGPTAQNARREPLGERLDKLVAAAMNDVKAGIEDLKVLGFRHFVIGTMPELGGLIHNPHDPFKTSDATFYAATAAHNRALGALLETLQKQNPSLTLTSFQAFAINQRTNREPQKFGFTRLDAPCFVGNLRGSFYGAKRFCPEPSAHKFWEYIHPSSKMHCYYASQFLADLSDARTIPPFDQDRAIARCRAL